MTPGYEYPVAEGDGDTSSAEDSTDTAASSEGTASTLGDESGSGAGDDTGTTSPGDSGADDSPTGDDPQPEVCDGVDNDLDGLVDEVAQGNTQCDSCRLLQYSDRAYYFCVEELDWLGAAAACADRGAFLASVRDDFEGDMFHGLQPMGGGNYLPDFWIGLNDRAVEGDFVWEDGTPAGYTRWYAGEPNQMGEEDCTQVRSNGTWNDMACEDTRPGFACSATHTP